MGKLETIRLIDAGLADVSNGINAKIAALTLDGSDARPSNPTVYTDVDDKWVARRRVSDDDASTITFPALAVFQIGRLEAIERNDLDVVRDFAFTVGFRYLLKKQDSALATRDGLYFNRAIARWFNWFITRDPNSATRTKNGITIVRCLDFSQSDVRESWASADCIVGTDALLHIREATP